VGLAKSFRDLDVYKLAFETAMEIFEISKKFPIEERYSLTDQVRRASRSVCVNIAEGWRKRKYKAVFINKMLDSAQEAAEVQSWLDFALKCGYIDEKTLKRLDERYEHIFAMLNTMEQKAESFCKCVLRPTSHFPHPTVSLRRPTSHIPRSVLIVLSLAFCYMLCASGCSRPPVEKHPIRLSLDVWPGYAAVFVAREKGFFKKNNVDVELILKPSTTETLTLVQSGAVDGGFDALGNVVILNTQGFPVKIVYIMDYSTTGDVIIGRPEIKSVQDLKGKTVSFEGINSFSHYFVLKILEKAGLKESDLYFKVVRAHEVLKMLQEKQIDAGHTWEPTRSQAIKEGYKVIAMAGDIPGVIIDVLFFNSDIIERRPDDVLAIVKSVAEAIDYQKKFPEESIKIMAKEEGMSEEEMKEGIAGVYQPDIKDNFSLLTTTTTTTNPSIHSSGISIIDFYLEHGQLSKIPVMEEIIEDKFVKGLHGES